MFAGVSVLLDRRACEGFSCWSFVFPSLLLSSLLSRSHRSPSPEPIYNSEGKRLNTREYRTRKKIEEERHALITEMVGLNPEFKPPADYK